MLTLNFEVFPNDEDAEAQARGVVAALVAIYGEGVVPASYVKIGEVERATGPVVINRYDAPAPDGYPVEAEQPTEYERSDKISHVGPNERDTAGIPWDERIHAGTKTTNKDGTWTRRRNTPDEVFDKVMAELKAANTAMTLEAAAGLTAPQPSAAEAFTPPPSVVIPPAVPVAHVPTPPVPAVPAPPAPVAVAPDDTAAEPVEIMKAVNAKRVPADKLQEIIGKAGLDGLAKVFTAPIEARRIIAAELAAL